VAKHGIARVITKQEARQILDLCVARGLAQIADNTKDERAIICNCCGCCCDLLLGYKRFGNSLVISPSRFIARTDPRVCAGCGACAKRCPAGVISVINKKSTVNEKLCLGCGVCVRFCPTGALKMDLRSEAVFTPQDSFERVYLSAVRNNKLGNFIFDDQSSLFHYLFRNLFNAAIRFPLIKIILLNRSFYFFIRKMLDRATAK
jgi:ferredoxin